jgi:phage-related minor tail protein
VADLSLVFDLLAKDRASGPVGKVGDSMKKAGDQTDKFGDKVKGAFGLLAGVAAGAGLAVGAAFGQALETESAGRQTAAQLGLDPSKAAEMGRLAGDLYAVNYGDSMESVQGAIGAVVSSIDGMRDANGAAIKGATADALNFASAFGTDVNESVGTVGQLIRTGLVSDATQGFDLMTAAYQRVPAAMREELPDILNEYGTNFAQLGYNGQQAFGLLTSAAGGGQIVLDKTGDALKELSIRATDMSTTSVAAYEAAGLNAEDMAAKILQGGPAAQQATQQIAQGLLSIEDPVARSNAAIGLFGTPLEDLGVGKIPTFLSALAGVGPGMTDAGGAAGQLDATLSTGIGPRLETLKRGAQTAAGEGIQALINGFTQGSTDGAGWQGTLQNLASTVSTTLGPALSGAGTFLTDTLLPKLGELASWMTDNQGTITIIAGLISGVLATAFTVWGTRATVAAAQNAAAWISAAWSAQTGAARSQLSALQVVTSWVMMGARAAANGVRIAAVWTAQVVASAVSGAASMGMQAARFVGSWVLMGAQAFVQGLKIAAVWTAQVAASAISGAASMAVQAARFVAQWVIMGTQALLQAARVAAAWLIAMGPIGIVIAAVIGLVVLIIANFGKIKGWISGAWDWVKSKTTGAWNSIKTLVSNGVQNVVDFVKGIPGKIGDLAGSLYQKGKDMIQGLINGAGSLLRSIGSFFLNMLPGWIRGPFESALGIASPSKVFRDYGINIGQGLIKGLTGSSKDVADTSKKLADSITKAWEGFSAKRKKLTETLAKNEQRLGDLNRKYFEAGQKLEAAWRRTDKGRAAAVASATKAFETAGRNAARAREAVGKTRVAIVDLQNQYGRLGNKKAVQSAVAMLRRGDDALLDLAKRREQVAKQLEAAQGKLADAVKMRNDFAASVRDSARSFASLTDIKTAGSPRVLVDELQQRLTAIQKFRAQLAKLAKLGVSRDVYQQIAEAGVEAGGATADALLAGGPKTIKQVNKLQAGIASESTKLGTDASRKLYQAGVDAAQGLVNGLSKQTKQLKQAAERLAANLEAAVKRRLGIRSPSTVFEGVGTSIGEGLAEGIKGMQPVVAAELAALADTQAVQSLQAAVGVDPGAGAGSAAGYRPPVYDAADLGAAAPPAAATRTVNVSGVVGPAEVAALVAREQRRDEFLAGAGT